MMNNLDGYTIAVDFDGTIVENEFPKIGKLKSKAKEALLRFRTAGVKIIIHTCRTDKVQEEMAKFLLSNGIPYDEINANCDCPEAHQKPMADVYLDDRGMEFISWEHVLEILPIKLLSLKKTKYIPLKNNNAKN